MVKGSWAVPPIGNSPALRAAQAAPCPEGLYLIVENYITDQKPGFWLLLSLDDALDRANRDALGRIVMTNAFHASGLIDDVQDAIAFADRFGGTFGHARAAGDAIFLDFHGHGSRSVVRFSKAYRNGMGASIDECREFG